MDAPRRNKDITPIKLILSIALSVIAIGLVPLTFLAVMYYQVFGIPSLSMVVALTVSTPLISSLIAVVSLFLAISARRCFRFGWIVIILSCCSIVFPFIYTFWSLH